MTNASAIDEVEEVAFWGEAGAVVQEDAPRKDARVFDLEGRTALFGEAVINFAKTVPRSPLTNRLIDQIVGCGSSVGANYCEADDAVSRKEFFLRINTCRKEARETKHFLRMIVCAVPELKPEARVLCRKRRN